MIAKLLDRCILSPETMDLGPVVERVNVRSSMGPFRWLPGYRIRYPQVVIDALTAVYAEYNRAFEPLIVANREWEGDYRHATMRDGSPLNCVVQIDMVGLPQSFLSEAARMPHDEMVRLLRGRIFEVENSLAMYELLLRIFEREDRPSFFAERFRKLIEEIRCRFGKPIALLAVTEQKYRAMLESEFGWKEGEPLPSSGEVKERTGFDDLFGPEEFKLHLEQNGGICGYLLYVRSSDPVAKLKKPGLQIEHPILGDARLREIVKAHSLTLNIDAPEMSESRRINDTKEYLPPMGMGFLVNGDESYLAEAFRAHLSTGKPQVQFAGERLAEPFAAYLLSHGINPDLVSSGDIRLRAKPVKGTYGCYGHLKGVPSNSDFRIDLRRNIRTRGRYILQPELATPTVIDATSGQGFLYIDRVFFGSSGDDAHFLGGFRDMLPLDSEEAKRGRIHGNAAAAWAEIT